MYVYQVLLMFVQRNDQKVSAVLLILVSSFGFLLFLSAMDSAKPLISLYSSSACFFLLGLIFSGSLVDLETGASSSVSKDGLGVSRLVSA